MRELFPVYKYSFLDIVTLLGKTVSCDVYRVDEYIL